jgi:hypothetical protein
MLLIAAQNRTEGCALERVRQEFIQDPTDMLVVAKHIGLTVSEAVGIMDGWDLQTKGRGAWVGAESVAIGQGTIVSIERDEYNAGLAMGQELARQFGGGSRG